MSILFHHYKELKECISEVEGIEKARVGDNSSRNKELAIKEEEPTTLDSYFIRNNTNYK
jgi:hypothetical protein